MNAPLLSTITGPADVKRLSPAQLDQLADEMRAALIEKLSRHGGHIGPNLGFVEATVALHHVFDSPRDKLVFDVSHQSYGHKMLTGRAQAFLDPAHYDDVSGFTEPAESDHDLFTIGHTSTSVSLAVGLARARDLMGGTENVVAILGDGSLSGGEALEGLDMAGEQGTNLIVVLNDNEMSIAENHGGLYENLRELRESGGTAANNLFRAMGLDYLYVEDGNSVRALVAAFERVRGIDHPVVVHIHTKKGKGLPFAEADPEPWHAGGPFDPKTGSRPHRNVGETYSELVGKHLLAKMVADPAVVAINAATPTVLGFTPERRAQAGRQFVDVGIAEETAAAMAAGVAKRGGKPVWGVYSTFMQRTYDQVSHDICINSLPVTILVFGASLDSMNDATHLGFFDIPLLSNIPNLVYLAPTCAEELMAMLDWSLEQRDHPVAIRVPPRVEHGEVPTCDFGELNRSEVVERGEGIAILAVGSMMGLGRKLAAAIAERRGVAPTLVNPRYLTGLDEGLLSGLANGHTQVITLEDGVLDGGFGQKVAAFYGDTSMRVRTYGLAKRFLDRYDADDVRRERHLTVEQILEDVL